MTNEEFEALVTRLEEQARRRPARYARRVLLMALLGNVYLGAMLLLVTALLVGAIASVAILKAAGVKLAFVVGVFLWLVLKAIWFRVPPPEGVEIGAQDAPELFAMIESLRQGLGAPRFHHVLINDEFNAGVVQASRLGPFGWSRNYLLIGLPLAKALSVEQFKAVLAHEFGHLAKGHGRMSNWIYRQRLRWARLMSALEETESKGSFLFRPFLRWYAPYFNAYSFPLARANEYEADATSARLTSPRAAAEALTGVSVAGAYLGERYWPQIHRKAEDLPQPAFAPYADMGRRLAAELDEGSTRGWLEAALARKTTLDDTHPALSERLGALGEHARLAPPAPQEAADRLLGAGLERVTQAFDRRWHERILPAWEGRYREAQEGRARLAELDAKHASGTELSAQERYDRALLTESLGSNADGALEQLRALQQRVPEDPVVLHALGVRLLARDDEAGRALVERAMQRDEFMIVACAQALRDFHWRHGREDEARAWHERLTERAGLEEAAAKERSEVRLSDKFEHHGLDEGALAQMLSQLRSVEGLRKVYFVRKRVQHLAHRPCYVLGYTAGGLFVRNAKRRITEALAGIQQAVTFPGESLIISVEGGNYRFGRKFRWMRGSRIL